MSDTRKELRDTICKLGAFVARTRAKMAIDAECEKRPVNANEDMDPKVERADEQDGQPK